MSNRALDSDGQGHRDPVFGRIGEETRGQRDPGKLEIPRPTRAHLPKLSREQVAADQRRRVLASREAIWRHGYLDTTVQHVLDLAGVSRTTFYDLYSDRHDVAHAAHAETLVDLDRHLAGACETGEGWPAALRRGLGAVLAWAAADPPRANLLLGELPASSSQALALRDALIDRFAPFLRRGRPAGTSGLPDLLEEGIVGGLAELIATRLRSDPASLPALAPELARLVLCVYAGSPAGGLA